MFSKILILFAVLMLRDSLVNSHGNGAPSNRCDTMMPGHWVSPQESISPYQVIIDKTVIVPGDRVNITLRTVRGQPGFKGFMVMVKDGEEDESSGGGDEGSNTQQRGITVYGDFDVDASDVKNSQPVHCFNRRNSAMTHVTNDVKEDVELSWIAPTLLSENNKKRQASSSTPYMERELKVVATFVKDFWTVWTEVEPVGGARLLLTDTHQLSPKFQAAAAATSQKTVNNQSPPTNQEFRGEPIIIDHHQHQHHHHPHEENYEGLSKSGQMDNLPLPLEENASWIHFKRAWNYMVDLFNSAASSMS